MITISAADFSANNLGQAKKYNRNSKVPCFVVEHKGRGTMKAKLDDGHISGILQLDIGFLSQTMILRTGL